MKNLVFRSKEFGQIRTCTVKGETYFVGKDVASALGYGNSREALRKHVDEEDKQASRFVTGGQQYNMTVINESGLYSLILSSKLESAKRFKHWVTSEVLPSIRKQGGYMVARPDESDEVIMARALQIMHATIQRRDEQIAKLQPKADYADHVLDSVDCFTTTQIAKGMGMTGHDLNRLLCHKRIQYSQSGQYLLYAPYARQGLAKNRTIAYEDADGNVKTRSYLVWTERGKEFIYHLLTNKIAI